MTFVPTTTGGAVAANVSPRARDLARTLDKSISEFQERNPSLSDQEVRQALMLVSRSRTPGSARNRLVVAFTLGLVAAVLGLLAALGVIGG